MNIESALRQPLVLYDSDCLLCSRFIQFILKNEVNDRLCFAALDSPVAAEIISKIGGSDFPDSVVFYNNGKIELESRAVLSISRYLKRPYSYMRMFSFVPSIFLDRLYKIIAGSRYKIFGKATTHCSTLHPDQAHRFFS